MASTVWGEPCLSLRSQTLSSSTLGGERWLILARTLQSCASLEEKWHFSVSHHSCLGGGRNRFSTNILTRFVQCWKETFRNSWYSNPCSSRVPVHLDFLNLDSPTSKTQAFVTSSQLVSFQLSVCFLYWVHMHTFLTLIKVSWDVQNIPNGI